MPGNPAHHRKNQRRRRARPRDDENPWTPTPLEIGRKLDGLIAGSGHAVCAAWLYHRFGSARQHRRMDMAHSDGRNALAIFNNPAEFDLKPSGRKERLNYLVPVMASIHHF